MREGKQERKKEEKEEEQNRKFHIQFLSTVVRINATLVVYFTLE